MKIFTFQIEQRPAGANQHSWVAIEVGSNQVVPLPVGGNGASVGQYPEIQEYLLAQHHVSVLLTYITQIDTLQIREDGTTIWTFNRQQAEVTVYDIPRVSMSVTVQL